MTGVTDPKTNTEVLGIPLSVPVLTAPFGGDALFAPEGHLAVARANAACGIASIVPEVGSFSYEEVAAAAPAAARIGQLHPHDSFDVSAARIKAAGYDALCVTVDCPIVGFRARNRMARFRPDPAIWGGNVTARRLAERRVHLRRPGGPRVDLGSARGGDRPARDAVDRQGHPHRRGRRGGPRRGRVGDPRLQPRRPPGRPGPGQPRRPARDRRRRSAAASRSCSTAASAPAPTSSSPWPWALRRWSSAAWPPTAWRPRASTASAARSSCSPRNCTS